MLQVSLFGRCKVRYSNLDLTEKIGSKELELLTYLCLNRDRSNNREVLSTLLWGDYCDTSQARTYLRKALCNLQKKIRLGNSSVCNKLFSTNANWIKLNTIEHFYLDVAELESKYHDLCEMHVTKMTDESLERLDETLKIYSGDLLAGWYQEWCIIFRERYQLMYLGLLDKAIAYCESQRLFHKGLIYGNTILQFDVTRERTHRQIMKLYYLAGDRTGAIRQFDHCRSIMQEEWELEPSQPTIELLDKIKKGRSLESNPVQHLSSNPLEYNEELLSFFKKLKLGLEGLHLQVQSAIMGLEDSSSDSGQK